MRHAFLLLALAVPVAVSAQVVVTVSTDRAAYLMGETIQFSLTATNPAASPVALELGYRPVGFTLNGTETSSCSRCAYALGTFYRTFGPGESATWGGPREDGQSCFAYTVNSRCPALAPGTYTVRGTLYGVDQPPTYGAAETTITVVPRPVPSEAGPDAAGHSLRVAGPNPARGTAGFVLRIPASETLTLNVLDALGRVVRAVQVAASAGETRIGLDVRGLAAGAYVVRVAGRPALAARFVVVR